MDKFLRYFKEKNKSFLHLLFLEDIIFKGEEVLVSNSEFEEYCLWIKSWLINPFSEDLLWKNSLNSIWKSLSNSLFEFILLKLFF